MATLNELGRNSASVTYGPYVTGQDHFPTVQAVDAWLRNDTYQGTAAGTSGSPTLAGTGSIWTTQARAGDSLMIAGQLNSVLSTPTSDTSMTLASNLTASVSGAALHVISSSQPKQVTGYLSSFARGDTFGTVSCTNGSTTITGVGTYFLSEATSAITTVAMTGTVAIAVDGTITGTSTVFSTGAPTNNSLYPGDSVTVTLANGAVYYFEIKTVSSDTSATVAVAPTIAISGATIAKATNGATGRAIQINGRIRTVTAIASNTSMTVNFAMDFNDTNLRYKVYPRGTLANASSAGGTLYGTTSSTSSNSVNLTVAATVTGTLLPGCVITTPLGVGTVPAGTTIVNQQYAATGTTASNNTAVAGTTGTNVLTTSGTQTGTILVGHLVTGNGAAITGIPAGTYVVGITGTTPNFTVTLSQNITSTVSGTVYFAVGGGTGVYTTSVATTLTTQQIYWSTVQATNANLYWDLGVYNLNSTTNTPYMYQISQLDNIWIGDEVRTVNFSTFGGTTIANTSLNAYLTDYAGYGATTIGALRQTVFGMPFRREDSYINGNPYGTLTQFLSDFRVGDDIIIDGTECTVVQVVSDSQIRVDISFTHTTADNSGGAATTTKTYDSGGAPGATTVVLTANTGVLAGQLITGAGLPQGTYVVSIATNTLTLSKAFNTQATGTYSFYNGTNIYKKLKLHGWTLEGTREGGVGIQYTATNAAQNTVSSATGSSTTLTLNAAPGVANSIYPGMYLVPWTTNTYAPAATILGQTYIVNQLFGVSAGSAGSFTGVGTIGTNIITTSALIAGTAPTVGQLVCGNGAVIAGIPPSTYVLGVTGTSPNFTVYLSNNLTATVTSQTIYFYAAGNQGAYTTSTATTISAGQLAFYASLTGKFTQPTTILATNGTIYPIGSTSIVVATAPTVGQYNFVKIAGAGGPPQVLTGQVTYVQNYVTGTNTLFTTQLHNGAEIVVAGQYLTVVNIISDTQLVVRENSGVTTGVVSTLTPIYRSIPLYTYALSTSTTTINLATPIKNPLYSNAANPPQVYFPSQGCDFLEYVYSAPNYSAEQGSTTLLNQSLDRKYMGFRYWPLFQSTNATPTATATMAGAFGAYSMPVYERWTAAYGQTHGVGINQADQSGGTMVFGSQATTVFTTFTPVCGSLNTTMSLQGLSTGYPNPITAVSLAGSIMGSSNTQYAVTTSTISVLATPVPVAANLYGVYDIIATTQVAGGTIFLFANKRYAALQGRSAAGQQTAWIGCIEFERAQPEDVGTGTLAGTGITFGGAAYGGYQMAAGYITTPTTTTPGFSQVLQYTAGIAPYPTFAYFNGSRMPTGAQQIPTFPQLGTAAYPVHGCVLSCPRVKNSAGDIVGYNAHIYSALTVTTGRWGHVVEMGNYGGSYNPAYLGTNLTPTSNLFPTLANSMAQVHMGQIIPVFTNTWNAKRFMFSPVVVLGPAYDPDVRGRIYGLKVLPSGLGTLMDTVSITVDASTFFYGSGSPATDHWVISTPPSFAVATALPGQAIVATNRITLTQNAGSITQSWRSLEDTATNTTNSGSVTTNNFRFALPA